MVVALAVKLARAGQITPGVVVLGHRLVEQRALGVARVVALGSNTPYSAVIELKSPNRCQFGLFEGVGMLDPEYTVLGRVARRIWAMAMKEKYGANDPRGRPPRARRVATRPALPRHSR